MSSRPLSRISALAAVLLIAGCTTTKIDERRITSATVHGVSTSATIETIVTKSTTQAIVAVGAIEAG